MANNNNPMVHFTSRFVFEAGILKTWMTYTRWTTQLCNTTLLRHNVTDTLCLVQGVCMCFRTVTPLLTMWTHCEWNCQHFWLESKESGEQLSEADSKKIQGISEFQLCTHLFSDLCLWYQERARLVLSCHVVTCPWTKHGLCSCSYCQQL